MERQEACLRPMSELLAKPTQQQILDGIKHRAKYPNFYPMVKDEKYPKEERMEQTSTAALADSLGRLNVKKKS
ncbi:Hypothetical predicted protein [Cloeon dipterum]|uniref:Uncharacterized protein n=1 Tax=Cloeon dipterum TaxID=197152 RepID=A0A8S1DNX4_9INSE|nr:Hypothetical predicted protein [Cloeon dipterum]